ncbi:MAG: serine hydrolase [Clostridia bacterium]|nr:serine hydrolase [Clostridia bacterium]
MKKLLCIIIAVMIAVSATVIYTRERKITVYRENETREIKAKEAASYIEDGWYEVPVVRIYNKDGGTLLITEESFSGYDSGEWAKEPFKAVYSDTAEVMMVVESEYEAYLSDGWHAVPPDHEGLSELKKEIESFIKTQSGSWGVFIQDLSTNEYLLINEARYSAASLVKIYTMAATYSEIEKGNLEKNADISHCLRLMITESSNEACNYLTIKNGGGNEAAGFDRENEISRAKGCENTERGSYLVELSGRKGPYRHHNYTSPRDCGRMLKAIYNKELISESASEEMLSLLLDQTRRWKIPAGLPEGTVVANKTGETDTANSDIAIVFSPGKDYIICVLGNGNVAYGATTIQKISRMAYDYFN